MYIKSTRFHIGGVKNLLFGLVVKISFFDMLFFKQRDSISKCYFLSVCHLPLNRSSEE